MTREDKLAAAIAAFSDTYTFLNADGSAVDGPIQPLGEGGSSIVLRAAYKNRLPRAVKIMIPRDDFLNAESGLDLFRNSFENEREALSEVSHEHISRITDFSEVVTEDYGGFPYVVMELISGKQLLEWAEEDTTSGHQIMIALQQLLEAVQYLHEKGVMHSDIKEDNVIVTSMAGPNDDDRVKACLVDLGVSHDLRSGSDGDYLYFFSTKDYVIPDLELVLGNKTHNRINRANLRRYFPWQDLYSIGVVMDHLTGSISARRKIRHAVGQGGLRALKHIASQLMVSSTQTHNYPTVLSIIRAVSRISLSSLAPLGETLLSGVGSRGILVPGAGRIATPPYLDGVVSHPVFQRLHQLPQLDLLQYVLPGATHSRFAHALDEMSLARMAINQQLHHWEFRVAVAREDIAKTLLGSLLNSVGRYQLHHMFEDYLPYRGQVAAAHLLDPDEVRDALIGVGPNSERFADAARDSRGRLINDVLGNMDWRDVGRLTNEPADPIQGFLAGLLDSPLDVNKLSYLRADSKATGVPFGLGLRPEALFGFLRVARDVEWAGLPTERRGALGLGEDGISYAEHAIMTRYWNIQTTYWNRINRALQSMVKYVIGSLLMARRFDFDAYLGQTLHAPIADALSYLSTAFDRAVSSGAIDGDSVNPLNEIRSSERNAYRRLLTISPKSNVEARSKDSEIYQRISSASPLNDPVFCGKIAEVLESELPGVNARPGEILLDVPRARRDNSEGRVLVYSDPPDAAYLGDLSQASPVLASLSQSFELFVKRLRIFVHPRVHAMVMTKEARIHEALLARLHAEVRAGTL